MSAAANRQLAEHDEQAIVDVGECATVGHGTGKRGEDETGARRSVSQPEGARLLPRELAQIVMTGASLFSVLIGNRWYARLDESASSPCSRNGKGPALHPSLAEKCTLS